MRMRAATTGVWVVAGVLAAPPAFAQAWVPAAGQGSVTMATQVIENTGHVTNDGQTVAVDKSRSVSIYLEADYAITGRLSVAAGVPFVFTKYLGPRGMPIQPADGCYCWRQGLQDFGVTARYNLWNGAAALTPSVSYGLPSHDYGYVGEAVVGRRLRELRLVVDAGLRLDAVSPRLAVQGRYSYAFVERVLDVPNNRSNLVAEALFQVTDALQVRGGVHRQITHGGLRGGNVGEALPPNGWPFGDITTADLFGEHDRLVRDNHWRLGAGLSYGLSWADVFVSYLEFVGGTNTHAGRAFTAGLSVPFGRPRP